MAAMAEPRSIEVKNTHHIMVYDEEQVKAYGAKYCAGLNDTDGFVKYLYLASRNKYAKKDGPGYKDTQAFNRITIYKDSGAAFLRYVKAYEVPIGVYVQHDETPVEDATLVLYFILNPRSTVNAFTALSNKVLKHLTGVASMKLSRMESSYKSLLHASNASKPYIELDIDVKDPDIIMLARVAIQPFLQYEDCTVETHGGYHVVFKNMPKPAKSELWKEFNKMHWKYDGADRHGKSIVKSMIDVRSDPSPPIPGTLQAGFKVRELVAFWSLD